MAVRIRTASSEQPRTADNSSAEPSKYGQGFYSFDVHKVRNKCGMSRYEPVGVFLRDVRQFRCTIDQSERSTNSGSK
jgi:hypothetical protein